jgi:hypothetical protein
VLGFSWFLQVLPQIRHLRWSRLPQGVLFFVLWSHIITFALGVCYLMSGALR